MKKVLVCALAALFLMASCLTAFAEDTPNYVTTTTYVTDAEGEKLQVETNVTSATNGDMLTYLAYKEATLNEGPNDSNIKYIDQQTVVNNSARFTYTTAKENLTGVIVKFGTSSESNPYTRTEAESERTREVTVVLGSDDFVQPLPTETTTGIYTTDLPVPTGYTVESATLANGENVKSLIDVSGSTIKFEDDDALDDGSVITVTLAAPDLGTAEIVENTVKQGHFNGYEASKPVEKMTVFGQITSDASDDSDWGGIILTDDSTLTTETFILGANGVTPYRAYHKNSDGQFAVQLVNKSTGEETDDSWKELTTKTWYARVYVKSGTGNTVYSDIITFNPIVDNAE